MLNYSEKPIANSLDNTKSTIYLDKIGLDNIYENSFENVIYLKRFILSSTFDNVVLKQGKKVYVLQDKVTDLGLIIPNNEKIFVYKDYKVLDMLSQEKDTNYTFEDSNIYNDYEVLEVKFNGESLDIWTFDPVLKKIGIGANVLNYNYINNIQVLLAKKVNNISDISFIAEYITHSKIDKKYPMEQIEKEYFNLTPAIMGYTLNRNLYENFDKVPVMNNKAIHRKAKNFRSEIQLKLKNIVESENSGNYGAGLYGSGIYGGGEPNITNIFRKQYRFRFITQDIISGEINIINNCIARDNYTKNYTEELNTVDYEIDGDKNLIYIAETDKSGFIFYELCFK